MIITDENCARGLAPLLQFLARKDGIIFAKLFGEFAQVNTSLGRVL